MMPEDDFSWPDCPEHGDKKHWCQKVREILVAGEDAIEPKLITCVPIVPELDIYAPVSIGDAVIPMTTYNLSLVPAEDPFAMPDPDGDSDEGPSLGLWTVGEGRLVITTILIDWASGSPHTRCISSSHGFAEEMKVQKSDKRGKDADRWSLAYYGTCWPCQQKRLPPLAGSGASQINFTATSFGLEGIGNQVRTAASGRQARAMDALRNRYTSRMTSGQDPTPQGDNTWNQGDF